MIMEKRLVFQMMMFSMNVVVLGVLQNKNLNIVCSVMMKKVHVTHLIRLLL
ncbi:hypothetical protein IFM89_009257 [Coptis chinensis]|uniref:Uncharacterized protein n=1 Tax=Coptis chinensis TaxID=261450 RepID=A0A835IC14_9MAGN|nr:hypothetical protein IFM89_009257 [Coptis chinensis]